MIGPWHCPDPNARDYEPERCDYCAGRGFQLDWIDHGGQMRAVPGDTCQYCHGSGERADA